MLAARWSFKLEFSNKTLENFDLKNSFQNVTYRFTSFLEFNYKTKRFHENSQKILKMSSQKIGFNQSLHIFHCVVEDAQNSKLLRKFRSFLEIPDILSGII